MYRQYEHTSHSTPTNDNRCSITLLTRDPGCLFAFWEISEEHINTYVKEYGNQLWRKTIPSLKITNLTKNESFIIRINDFSDSWYINIPDSNSMYAAEIGRVFPGGVFISFACSNHVSVPTNNISPNSEACFVDVTNMTPEYSLSAANHNICQPVSSISKLYTEIHDKSTSEYPVTSSESFLKG